MRVGWVDFSAQERSRTLTVLDLLAGNPSLFGVDFDVSEAVGVQVRRRMAKGYEVFCLAGDGRQVVPVVAFLHGPGTLRR